MDSVRVRIAPSPTGEDLHIGNVYTAFINYLFAKQNHGKFILRIEDTDRKRFNPKAEERIFASLSWFGLIPDEGPGIGGPYGPYRQSERKEIYRHFAEELVEKGAAYYCFCSPERLEKLRQEQKAKKIPTLYDGHCKNLSLRKIKALKKEKKYVIRLNVPKEGKTEFFDLIRGRISFENRLIDDQVLLKSDGYPTYHLGVVVDDYLMKISHVIRAEEWISSVPKHILLYKFFGWKWPIFVHLPIIRNPDKSKLSKRKNPVWVSWYRKEGYLPEAILNYLVLLGWSPPFEREIFTLEELLQIFRLEEIKPVGPAFDLRKLEWMNGVYLRRKSKEELKNQIYEFYEKKYSQKIIEKTIPLIVERIKKLSDYLPLCQFFFERPQKFERDFSGQEFLLEAIKEELKKISTWEKDVLAQKLQALSQKLKMKTGDFFMFLRVAITGKKISPPLNESLEILGKKEVLARLDFLLKEKL